MNPLMLQIPAALLGGIMGAKATNLFALPVSAVSPRVSRAMLAAGVLGGGIGAWKLTGDVVARKRQAEEQALLEQQRKQMGLL